MIKYNTFTADDINLSKLKSQNANGVFNGD